MNPLLRPLVLAPIAASAGVPASADRIVRSDGTVLADVEVEQETLASVVYEQGAEKKTLGSELVLEVRFERGPKEVEAALLALQERDLTSALATFEAYVEAQETRPGERLFPWAPAFAAWKTVEIRATLADPAGVVSAAARLIASHPESRYVAQAYLAKATAEAELGDASRARATLQTFRALIDSRSLPRRWQLECRLAAIELDPAMAGDAKRRELAVIAAEAGTSEPTVASRARVLAGETFLQRAGDAEGPEAAGLREQARAAFEEVVRDPTADDATLARAHMGLGDCLFHRGAESDDPATLRGAALEYLRVIALYEGRSSCVPRCYYYAMRAFDRLRDERRKGDLRRELSRLYPNSSWAQEARKL